MAIEEIAEKVRNLRGRSYQRDQRMLDVRAVRNGDISNVLPGLFPDAWPKPIVANTVDVAARVLAESTGTMPTVACTTGIQVSDLQKKKAQTRTLIVQHYIQQSRLGVNLLEAADWFNFYGFLPVVVEPCFTDDFSEPGPIVRFDNPVGAYYDLNVLGRTRCYVKVYDHDVERLISKFPALRDMLRKQMTGPSTNQKVELIHYVDDERILFYLPSMSNLVLLEMENKFGECPVYIAESPKFDDQTRGSFDDVAWVQLAKARMALMGMEAAEKSVNAPLALPFDVQKVSLGPDAIIRSNTPQAIRRVGLEMSPAAFQLQQLLENEMNQGARFPAAAAGKSPGSVVTGRGMEELMGTVDSHVKTSQTIIADSLRRAFSACLKMDEKFWPSRSKHIRVMVNGDTFEQMYKPKKDIDGVYQVDVTYGMAAGMNPNQMLVFLLQARGDKLISRDFALRQLPFDVNAVQIQQQIDEEEIIDSLKQGLFQYASNLGALMAQGQDPNDALVKFAKVIKLREKGTPLQDAIMQAFTPPKQPPGAESGEPGAGPGQAPGAPAAPGGAPQPGGPPGPPGAGGPPGAPPGAPPAPGGQQPGGGQPDIMSLLAGLTGGGQPNMAANIQRRVPSG